MLITTIILLVLTVIIASGISLSGMTLDLAVFKRNTSNTYYLAESAIEKQVDTMNKALITQMTQMIQTEVASKYIGTDGIIKDKVEHDTSNHILKAKDSLVDTLQDKIHTYLETNYVGTDKAITYAVQSDRTESDFSTQIEIQVDEIKKSDDTPLKGQFKLTATATTCKGTEVYDKQIVEAIVKIEVPSDVKNEIHERYKFANGVPDILNSALLCYSDVWVSGDGELTIKADSTADTEGKLGDVRVGGAPSIAATKVGSVDVYPEVDQNGGVIAIHGGKIHILKNLYTTRNILATNGWGGSYALSDSKKSSIEIDQDAIAYTIGIVDDFYEGSTNQSPYSTAKQVQDAEIHISQNAMVDNDVMIDRWVKGGKITIDKTLFGVGGGTGVGQTDPNQSSGVFSQGPDCLIHAQRMYVAGQPFITFGSQKPLRLWESIGEPFEGLASWEGYKTGNETEANKDYLDPDKSPFIKQISGKKIETNFKDSYAIGKISGKDLNVSNLTDREKGKVGQVGGGNGFAGNDTEAWKILFMEGGASGKKIENLMDGATETYKQKVNPILANSASDNLKGESEWSTRKFTSLMDNTYEGIKGYMVLMRALLYNLSPIEGSSKNLLKANSFDDVVALSKVDDTNHAWCYATPIEVIENDASKKEDIEINLEDYYVSEDGGDAKPYPTIIINKDPDRTLKLIAESKKSGESGSAEESGESGSAEESGESGSAEESGESGSAEESGESGGAEEAETSGKELRGWIISAGPVELGENVTVTGGIIIKGPDGTVVANQRDLIFKGQKAGLIAQEGKATIQHNPQVLLEVEAENHQLYRQILDALKLTDYSETALKDIMAKQAPSVKEALAYSANSILEVDTKNIKLTIESLKTK